MADQSEVAQTALVVSAPVKVVRMLRPVAEAAQIVTAQNETRALLEQALTRDRDYGLVPNTKKPTLFKAGAERIVLAFGCIAQFSILSQEIDHDRAVTYTKHRKVWRNQFTGDRTFSMQEEVGTSIGLYRYVVLCEIVSRETGEIVGSFAGSCSTMESKYIDRPRDCENTALKMAEKRALVGATLVTFGLSDQFTQDMEDQPAPAQSAEPSEQDAPPITRDSEITWGKDKGTPIRALKDDYLQWAVEPGRKFGADTEKWQRAMLDEVRRRMADDVGAGEDASETRAGAPVDDLPF